MQAIVHPAQQSNVAPRRVPVQIDVVELNLPTRAANGAIGRTERAAPLVALPYFAADLRGDRMRIRRRLRNGTRLLHPGRASLLLGFDETVGHCLEQGLPALGRL